MMQTKNLYQQMQARLPRWARRGILSGYCGSQIHGTYIPPGEPFGTDDTDVFQIVVHPRAYYLGLEYFNHERDSFQTHGEGLDIVVYELAKFISLLEKGNPNVNTYLWLQPQEYIGWSEAGLTLINQRDIFVSKKMFESFGGYAYGQLKRMTHGERMGYMGAERKKLFDEYGYDTKNAAHCVRLLHTALLLAETGKLHPRLPDPVLETIKEIKTGEWLIGEVERLAESLDADLRIVKQASTFPDRPNREEVNRVLRAVLEQEWDSLEGGR